MGKIRVSTIGDEAAEKEQKSEAKKRTEEKKKQHEQLTKVNQEKKSDSDVIASTESAKQSNTQKEQAAQTPATEEVPAEDKKKKKKEKFIVKKASSHSKSYATASEQVDKKKVYSLKEALDLLPKLKRAKFDETVELHINTIEQGVSGSFVLPHGTGKKTRVVIVSATKDPKALDDLIKEIEAGKINFDILVATPDSMPKLAKVARFLGPKGLMPNPKNGTVTAKPEEVAKKFEAGQFNFKTEAKAPIIHLTVGKVSFGTEQLSANIKTALKAIQAGKVRSVTLKSTMSPGIKLDFSII